MSQVKRQFQYNILGVSCPKGIGPGSTILNSQYSHNKRVILIWYVVILKIMIKFTSTLMT